MTSSFSLVLKHLDLTQQEHLIDDIVEYLKTNTHYETHSAYIDTFCELVGQPTNLSPNLEDFAYNYSISLLQKDDSSCYYDSILKLSLTINNLSERVIDFVIENLSTYFLYNPRHFNQQISNLVNIGSNKGCHELSTTFVLNLLKFTEWFFINNEEFALNYLNEDFDKLCFIYLTNEESEISKASSKILKWRMASICQSEETTSFLWKVIFLIQQSTNSIEKSYGYTLWLRFFGYFKPENLKTNEQFQKIISNEKYWHFLRDGLISITHEHKKYALTLIQMSVQSLSTNLSSPIIKWDCEKEAEYIESWKRLCTLYEILGIDAAMNQAQAATNDLLRIFAPDSDIPVPFALTILSVGFKASMDRIKKFALKLAFSLPKESLTLFKNDFKFISQVFLPFTMKSLHFTIQELGDRKYTSQFGNQLRDFICNCVDSLDAPSDISQLVNSIFDSLSENRLVFSTARIYVTWGVLKGLEKKRFKPLDSSVLKRLMSLFETTAEDDIGKTTLQTVHLKCMLQIDPTKVTIKSFIQALVYFIQLNGYKLYVDNEEFFLDYFNTYFQKEDFIELLADKNVPVSVEEFLSISSYLISEKVEASTLTPYILSHHQCPSLLVQMATSGLGFKPIWSESLVVSRVERFVNQMVDGSKSLDILVYSDCEKLFKNTILFSNEFWMSMRLDPLYEMVFNSLAEVDNSEEAKYYIAQFKFISLSFPQCVFNEDFNITFDSLKNLFVKSLRKVTKGNDKTFYKAKDELHSYILNSINSLFKINTFDAAFREKILTLVNDVVSVAGYHSHLSIVRLLNSFLANCTENEPLTKVELLSIVTSLECIWNDLIADRLVLSERDLHQAFIKLSLNPKLLIASINDDELADSLYEIMDKIISQSSGRKGLLPYLFKAISDYQVSYADRFEETIWLAKVLVKGTFLYQSEINIFQLDCILSEEFDKTLNISGESLYKSVYGAPELSYRVTIFAIIGSIKTPAFANKIWDFIFNNPSTFHFLDPKKRTDHKEQWKRIQFLSLLVATTDILESSNLIHYVEKFLLQRLFKDASPLCRVYIEWIVSIAISRVPDFKDVVFNVLKEGFEAQQPLVVVSFERISMLLTLQLDDKDAIDFLTKFVVDVVLPLASSNRALNRHFSTSMACVIYNEIVRKQLNFPPLLKETLRKIYHFARGSGDYDNYRVGDALLWDIKKDCNLVAITGGLLLKVSDREIDAIYEKDYKTLLTEQQKSILRIPIGSDEVDAWVVGKRSADLKLETYYIDINEENEESSVLQTKSGVWSTVLELDENARAAAQVKRSQLIVVSSLVDKPPNLGGICRLCDCLGAGWMTVDNISVKNDPEFKSVAVTADRWMPLIEVKIAEIAEFMRLKKKEGYTLIGLEQTDKSVELNSDLRFPEKSLILLGKEREGIPGDLLAELDMCVIIKQVGIVRSMNIQTATAVIVHAYSSQHC